MPYPIRKCVVCKEEFELKPDKPGFANRCPECTENDAADPRNALDKDANKGSREQNAERRQAMKNLLYRKDS